MTGITSTSSASVFPKLILDISSTVLDRAFETGWNAIISFSGARPDAMTASRASFGDLIGEARNTLWYRSFFESCALLNRAVFPSACVAVGRCALFSDSSTNVPSAFLFRGGSGTRNDLRCSFLPADWSSAELLMPAIAVSACSEDDATARVVTESSFFESSMSLISDS